MRECFIVMVAGVTSVIDAETLAVVPVDVLDTLVERPDTPA